MLQIDDAASDPITRTAILLSLVCTLMSLSYGCIYIVRFGTMTNMYKAAGFAQVNLKLLLYPAWSKVTKSLGHEAPPNFCMVECACASSDACCLVSLVSLHMLRPVFSCRCNIKGNGVFLCLGHVIRMDSGK